jgi:hypothetical protein
MNTVDIGGDDFLTGSTFVKLGNVASAIGKVLLANGSPNRIQAERDAWPFIHTGIVAGKLHPLAPETLDVLSINDYGNGVVGFDELVEWGLLCKRFEFVKQTELSAQDEYAPLPTLLADYWDEPLSELPENLRELVEDWWDITKPQYRPGMARSYDSEHDPALVSERKAGADFGYWSAVARDVGDAPDWEYWARFKYLTPIKAACLFVKLVPDNYPTIKNPTSHYNTLHYNGLVKYIDRLADYAETDNEGMKLSPAQWIEWAQDKGYAVPQEFIEAVAEVGRKAKEETAPNENMKALPGTTHAPVVKEEAISLAMSAFAAAKAETHVHIHIINPQATTTAPIEQTELTQKKENAPEVAVKPKVGRPKTMAKNAKMMCQLIECFETAAGIKFSPEDLPGSAVNLLDACQRLEKHTTGKKKEEIFNITKDTLTRWLKVAGYGFREGCTPTAENKYWTKLCVTTMSLITPEVFTEVNNKGTP